MALGDISVVGPQFSMERRIAASATRYEVGEPLYLDGATYTTGTASSNVFELVDADAIVLGTDTFGGVAMSRARPLETGTLVAHTANSTNPTPGTGMLRAKAETAASVDTDAELLLIINDATLIDYNATGAADGGELYTIKEVGAADTSAFTIRAGNPAKSTLDVTIDVRGYRLANDITA